MFCSKCGNQIADNNKFCPKCGNQVQNRVQPNAFFNNHSQGSNTSSNDVLGRIKSNMTNNKLVVLLLSVVGLVILCFVPYAMANKRNNYQLFLIGNEGRFYDFGDYEAVFSILFVLFVACLIAIFVSLLLENMKLCKGVSIANSSLALLGIILALAAMKDEISRYVTMIPVGSLLYIGLAVTMAVMIFREDQAINRRNAMQKAQISKQRTTAKPAQPNNIAQQNNTEK